MWMNCAKLYILFCTSPSKPSSTNISTRIRFHWMNCYQCGHVRADMQAHIPIMCYNNNVEMGCLVFGGWLIFCMFVVCFLPVIIVKLYDILLVSGTAIILLQRIQIEARLTFYFQCEKSESKNTNYVCTLHTEQMNKKTNAYSVFCWTLSAPFSV